MYKNLIPEKNFDTLSDTKSLKFNMFKVEGRAKEQIKFGNLFRWNQNKAWANKQIVNQKVSIFQRNKAQIVLPDFQKYKHCLETNKKNHFREWGGKKEEHYLTYFLRY